MRSSRPYISRALYEWLLDNDQTPYIVVNATVEHVVVPTQFVQNGQIVLNVAPTAVRDFRIENEMVSFNARFSGEAMEVWVPIEALMALYSRETGAGMAFGQEPVLPEPEVTEEEGVRLESVSDVKPGKSSDDDSEGDRPKPKKKPSLRVVK